MSSCLQRKERSFCLLHRFQCFDFLRWNIFGLFSIHKWGLFLIVWCCLLIGLWRLRFWWLPRVSRSRSSCFCPCHRRLAGIMLVEAIAKAGNLWVSMDTVIKSQIKDLLLTTLASIIPGGGGKASFIPGYRKGSLSRNPFKAVLA